MALRECRVTIRARFARLLARLSGPCDRGHAPHDVDPDGRELRQLLSGEDEWAAMNLEAIYRRLPDHERQRVLDRVRSWRAAMDHDSQSQLQKEV